MSAPEPAENGAQHLLVVIDAVARRIDGESVRIAKDVLSAGAAVKICLPDTPEEFARALARRGHRRPVVIGDDRALLRTVALLHKERELATGALSLVPIGSAVDLALASSLGVPAGAVAAARAVLFGVVRRLDLLVDDSDGVVLGDLRIPALPGRSGGSVVTNGASGANGAASRSSAPSVWGACRSLVRTLVGPVPHTPAAAAHTYQLRVEADGVVLSDLDAPVEAVTVRSRGGRAEVVIRTAGSPEPLRASALSVTVSGADFCYRADARVAGPVRRRTWTLRPGAWGLTLPVTETGAGGPGRG